MITLICPKYYIRLRYVLDYLSHRLGIKINVQLENNSSESANDIVINYTNQAIAHHFSIYNEGLLSEDRLREADGFPDVITKDNIIQLFPSEYDRYNINFDIFSAIFFCLSRYEEYLPFTADEHDRFTAQQSHAFRNSYLNIPVVDVWVRHLIEQLNNTCNLQLAPAHSFSIQPTIDIDSAWAFQHRGLVHQLGSFAKNIMTFNTKILKSKGESKDKDPYDTFEYLRESLIGFDSIYFILMHFERPYDTAHYADHPVFAELVKRMTTYAEVGIHPSYLSYDDSRAVRIEKEKLEGISNTQILKSRQHFLRLRFPETYDSLIWQDIAEDYSMGYAGQIGFRAGTSMPFAFYHLKNEEQTGLMIHPFCIMDVTLKQYHKYSIEDALDEVRQMKKMIKDTHGCLNFIWHNSSFAEFEGWTGWKRVFEELIKT